MNVFTIVQKRGKKQRKPIDIAQKGIIELSIATKCQCSAFGTKDIIYPLVLSFVCDWLSITDLAWVTSNFILKEA